MIRPGESGSKMWIEGSRVYKEIPARDFIHHQNVAQKLPVFRCVPLKFESLASKETEPRVLVSMPFLSDRFEAHLAESPEEKRLVFEYIREYMDEIFKCPLEIGLKSFLITSMKGVLQKTAEPRLKAAVDLLLSTIKEYYAALDERVNKEKSEASLVFLRKSLGEYPLGKIHGDFGFRNILIPRNRYVKPSLIDHTYQEIQTPLLDFIRLKKSSELNDFSKEVAREISKLPVIRSYRAEITLLSAWDFARWAPSASDSEWIKELCGSLKESTNDINLLIGELL